ncbi:MAG TPA: hypothetical protein PLK53_04900 [Bacillota bacterium]|nr:hypothetical protein [Bacillota bacterium]HRC53823.1 hypothetical protein [Bacillota bacterium]
MKDTIPVAIMTVIALVMILDFFIGDSAALGWINNTAVITRSWGIVISAFAMGLGAINLLRRHSRSIVRRDDNAFYSFLLVASMLVMIVLGVASGTESPGYDFMFSNILSPASSTMYASIAFYIVTAAYRSFSARNLEGWLLLITAVIVMLGKAPIGSVISDFFPVASNWIESVPNTAGMRAIMMGAALGVISSAVKMFLGLDKSYLGQR